MRLLANENIPRDAVEALRTNGHDVVWVREMGPGSTDDEVLAFAINDQRVLLTFDKDFGELAWRGHLPGTRGVILFRLPMPSPGRVSAVIAGRIGERNDWVDTSPLSNRVASACVHSPALSSGWASETSGGLLSVALAKTINARAHGGGNATPPIALRPRTPREARGR